MIYFRLIVLIFCVIIGTDGVAQSKLDIAKKELTQLKQSFLLVRLQTKDKTINLLEARGMNKEAEMVRKKQYEENRETILSFSKTFDFCPVYFFYSEDSEKIREGKLAGQVFDAGLNLVDSAELTIKPYYTAEFSQTKKLGISGLIIMDSHLIPLKPPFPYYERKYIFFSLLKISKARMAEKMNMNLHYYYREWFANH